MSNVPHSFTPDFSLTTRIFYLSRTQDLFTERVFFLFVQCVFFMFLLPLFLKHILPYKITFQKTCFEQFSSKTIEHTSYDAISSKLCLSFKHYTLFILLFSLATNSVCEFISVGIKILTSTNYFYTGRLKHNMIINNILFWLYLDKYDKILITD